MLEPLRERARKENLDIETRVMDGHNLELEDNTFDMAGSQFGVMTFPDQPRGIREMARVVKPGGRVLMTVYGSPAEIDFLGFFVGAVHSVRPDFVPPMDPPPPEFRLADPEKLRRELVEAGLKDVQIDQITERTEFKSSKFLWEWIIWSNPIVERILGMLNSPTRSAAPSRRRCTSSGRSVPARAASRRSAPRSTSGGGRNDRSNCPDRVAMRRWNLCQAMERVLELVLLVAALDRSLHSRRGSHSVMRHCFDRLSFLPLTLNKMAKRG